LQRRCDQNRKRSKRRAIYCPLHECHIHSVSQKYTLFTDRVEHLQQRGITRRDALMLVANKTTVPLDGEWLEAFWCDDCQETKWYHVRKYEGRYELTIVPAELWQQAVGVIQAQGNPSVGEFTRRQSRMTKYGGVKDFGFIV
jgi:hypothetical protein